MITTPAGGVPTPPPNNNSANNSGDESPAAKRKISTENGTSAVYQQSQATTQIKKPRNEVRIDYEYRYTVKKHQKYLVFKILK